MKKNVKVRIIDLIKDFCYSSMSLIIMNVVLQFIIYPYISKRVGQDEFGIIITLVSVVIMCATTFGSSLNYSRVVQHSDEKDSNSDSDNNNSSNNSEENDEEDINIKLIKGNYFIFAKTNKKKLISVPKSSKQPGAQLEIDNYTKGGSRQFEIEPIEEEGMFRIKSVISGLYWKIKEGFKQDEVIQDELDEESNEFKWIIETKEDDNKCVYIKSAVGGKDCEDFYLIIDGYVPKPHAKIVIGPYEQSQKFMLCRKV